MPTFPTLLLPLFLTGTLPAQVTKAPLHVLDTLKVGGSGGWDYVTLDPEAGRLYVPRSTRVAVLGLDGSPKGEIPNTEGVHGVALVKDLDRGFSSNGRANTMTVFSLSSLAVIKTVKTTGANPDAILFDPASRQVFTFNGCGANVTAFNAETLEVTGTIPVGGKPEFAVTDGKGRIYVNIEDKSQIVAINARTLKVEATWSIEPVQEPTGLAMDVTRNHLFSVGGNKLMAVVDAGTGKLVTTLPIGDGCDAAAFDAGTGRMFASNGEGSLTVIQADAKGSYHVTATVPTRKGARTMALDTRSHKVYLPTAEFGPVPAVTKEVPHPRPTMVPDSFQILVVGE